MENLENSDCSQGKILEKFPGILENPVSISLRFEKVPATHEIRAVFKEVQEAKVFKMLAHLTKYFLLLALKVKNQN